MPRTPAIRRSHPASSMPETTAPVGRGAAEASASGMRRRLARRRPAADSLWAKDPNRAYTEAVTRALVDAMIDYSAPMQIGADQWLTVAARDDEGRDTLAPPDPLEEIVTMIYRIKGSDLQDYRPGKIDRDEVRKRVQVSSSEPGDPGSGIRNRWPRCLRIATWSARSAPAPGAIALAALLSRSVAAPPWMPSPSLEPVDVVTGWFDAGIVEGGKNKLVPSVSLKLRNKSDEPIRSIQINAIFRRVGEQEMWGEYFGWAVPRTAAARRRRPPRRWCCARRSATPASSRACRCCRTRSSSTPRSRSI